jgi:hypothetical protein
MSSEQEQLVTGIATYLDQTYGDRSPAAMRKLFDRYDVDHDGKINKQELRKLLEDVDVGNSFTRGAWVRGILGQGRHELRQVDLVGGVRDRGGRERLSG